jgi:predicted phosphodiesterase
MKMTFIGDIHGKWDRYIDIIDTLDNSIQVGDFGVGFQNEIPLNSFEEKMKKGNHRFIRGNHDNPAECYRHPQWIPDGSYDSENGIFYMGGALSIDRGRRIRDVNWWENEELSTYELGQCIDEYVATKPRIVVTHDCPETVALESFSWYYGEQTRTKQALQHMFEFHQPEIWIFGHWHSSLDYVKNGTRFICLNELETLELEI